MCAKDEEKNICSAIDCICSQTYLGYIKILVVDNCSLDRTTDMILYLSKARKNREIEYVYCSKQGKANALNCALKYVKTKYFITVDADTFLEKNAIQNIMNHIVYKKSACVAGNLFVKECVTLIQKMQIYDYLLSIAAIKRFQGSYNSTLVAQGAFSVYLTEAIKKCGGWKDCLGEDIVLTYQILENALPSTYEPTAVGYTDVPNTFKKFYNQRKRWAIGMIDGFNYVRPWKQGTTYSKFFTFINISVIYFDLAYIFGFIPGVILAIFGYPYFVGLMTLVALVASIIGYSTLYIYQKSIKIKFKQSFIGFICFILLFQIIQSLSSIHGYVLKVFKRKECW